MNRLRIALTALARHPSPEARATGARLSVQATAALTLLADHADTAQTIPAPGTERHPR